jgi:hypothetical protein
MGRALSVDNVLSKRRKLLPFDGEWLEAMGRPELTGTWIIWGGSGSGKTTFTMQLAKYLTKFGRVAFNSMEEGDSESIKRAFQRVGMREVRRKLILLDNEPIAELKERLSKHKSPEVIIIDSLQYSDMSYKEYKALRDEFRNKLFVIISHAEGREPEGKVAKKVRYDAFVKIRVEGYRAFVVSRFGGGKPYDVWTEGAVQYHGIDSLTTK